MTSIQKAESIELDPVQIKLVFDNRKWLYLTEQPGSGDIGRKICESLNKSKYNHIFLHYICNRSRACIHFLAK